MEDSIDIGEVRYWIEWVELNENDYTEFLVETADIDSKLSNKSKSFQCKQLSPNAGHL